MFICYCWQYKCNLVQQKYSRPLPSHKHASWYFACRSITLIRPINIRCTGLMGSPMCSTAAFPTRRQWCVSNYSCVYFLLWYYKSAIFFPPEAYLCLILIMNKAEVHSDIKTYVYLLSNNLRAILHAVNRCTIHSLFFTKI